MNEDRIEAIRDRLAFITDVVATGMDLTEQGKEGLFRILKDIDDDLKQLAAGA